MRMEQRRIMTKIEKFYKLLFVLPLIIVACTDDTEYITEYVTVPTGNVLIANTPDTTIINTRDIVVGADTCDNDEVYEMSSMVMNEKGRVIERTLNCIVMGCFGLNESKTVVDNSSNARNVTVINRGKITIHTKGLVEKYGSTIQTPSDTSKPYTYLRVSVMYGGKGCNLINEGTIDVYFDHDPKSKITVYVIGMNATGYSSEMSNKGRIYFHGTGSEATRMRCMATFGDSLTAKNSGIMSAEVDMAEDTRMITTGGTRCNVINDGIMSVKVPGRCYAMTRYGDSNIINNGTIEMTSTDVPTGMGYTSRVEADNQHCCALYDPLQATRTGMPPLINRGTITIAVNHPTDEGEPYMQGYAMLCDLMSPKAEKLEVEVINDGIINVSQSAPNRHNVAEVGFVGREVSKSGACTVKMGRWRTALRNFADMRDLFLCKGVNMNFSGGELLLYKGGSYILGSEYSISPKALLYDAGNGDYRYEYSGYESMKVAEYGNNNATFVWNKDAMTAKFTSNQ